MVQFAFGGNTGNTPESLKQRRQMLNALVARTRQPQTFEGGLSAITAALAHRLGNARIDRQEQEGRDAFTQEFQGILSGQGAGAPQMAATGSPGGEQAAPGNRPATIGGVDPRLVQVLSNPNASAGQKAILQLMVQQQSRLNDPIRQLQQRKLERDLSRDPDVLSPEALAQKLRLRAAGAPSIKIDPNKPENAFGKEFAKENAKALVEQGVGARDASASLRATTEARKLLDQGIITGTGADYILGFGKALQQIGIGGNQDAIANTEAFVATRAQEVGRIIKLFGAGTGLSDADREFATKAAAGQISLTEQSIRRILDINEKASRNVIQRYNERVSQLPKNVSPFDLTVKLPESGGDFQTLPNGTRIRRVK